MRYCRKEQSSMVDEVLYYNPPWLDRFHPNLQCIAPFSFPLLELRGSVTACADISSVPYQDSFTAPPIHILLFSIVVSVSSQ